MTINPRNAKRTCDQPPTAAFLSRQSNRPFTNEPLSRPIHCTVTLYLVDCHRHQPSSSRPVWKHLELYDEADVIATLLLNPNMRELPERGEYLLGVRDGVYARGRWTGRESGPRHIRWISCKVGARLSGLPVVCSRLYSGDEW